MVQPTVSVVIPCYNGSRYLRETLESALGQTLAPLEVIVVDDGSTDDSAAIAESFGPPVRVVRQPNQGESTARNVGMNAASGDFLLFLDADDLLERDAVERLAKAAVATPGSIGIMGTGTFEGARENVVFRQLPTSNKLFPAIFGSPLGSMHSLLIPRTLAVEVGGFAVDIHYGEDWDFWIKLALSDRPLAVVPTIGALHRRHPGSQSEAATFCSQRIGHAVVIERMLSRMRNAPGLLHEFGAGAFWCGWFILKSSLDAGASWRSVNSLASELCSFARTRGCWGEPVRAAGLVRWVGPRLSIAIDRFRTRRDRDRSANARVGVAARTA